MILNLLVWIYITWLCLVWGNIFFSFTVRPDKAGFINPSPWIHCFTGLALIGVISSWLSLFQPAGFFIHPVFLVPAALYNYLPANRKQIRKQINRLFSGHSRLAAFMAAACVLLILLISSHYIIHPDTLNYHTKAIQWIEHYKAVPGLVHLDNELGLQSWWFTVQAIFRFSFISSNSFLFINGCVVVWFLLYTISQLNEKRFWGWVSLLAFALVSWTLVRLTAASASPDFIVALYIWGAFYLFLSGETGNKQYYYLTATLFCCAAITAKLSGIIMLLLPVCICLLLFKKQFKLMLAVAAIVMISVSPFIIRNVITTGYPLYPTLVADIFSVDWKAPQQTVLQFQEYISAYARIPVRNYTEAAKVMAMSPAQWIPGWWSALALTDKLLVGFVGLLFVANLITIKNQFKRSMTDLIILAICLIGTIVWFIKAPDPRFGACFLIPLVCSLGTGITSFIRLPTRVTLYKAMIIIVNACILAYIVFRLVNFFEQKQLLVPLGVKNAAYEKVNCNGHTMYRSNTQESGFIPFPSISDSCGRFIFRGNTIEEGFK